MRLALLLFITPLDPVSWIDAFDQAIQDRLLKPKPKTLGMSRVMIRPSMGTHFTPVTSDVRDFAPENSYEEMVLAGMEKQGLRAGLYLFGETVATAPAEAFLFRAMKGPGIITAGTPRAGLPTWQAMYPFAKEAMGRFAAGEGGYQKTLDGWTLAMRPAIASDARCAHCHQAKQGQAIGGVIYAFRSAAP
ncbi:MAG: hypothetical protein FJW30_22655 [Acidobacteria bacterium]|nr:hypothetical protein [Acidobacteriota bacterium]